MECDTNPSPLCLHAPERRMLLPEALAQFNREHACVADGVLLANKSFKPGDIVLIDRPLNLGGLHMNELFQVDHPDMFITNFLLMRNILDALDRIVGLEKVFVHPYGADHIKIMSTRVADLLELYDPLLPQLSADEEDEQVLNRYTLQYLYGRIRDYFCPFLAPVGRSGKINLFYGGGADLDPTETTNPPESGPLDGSFNPDRSVFYKQVEKQIRRGLPSEFDPHKHFFCVALVNIAKGDPLVLDPTQDKIGASSMERELWRLSNDFTFPLDHGVPLNKQVVIRNVLQQLWLDGNITRLEEFLAQNPQLLALVWDLIQHKRSSAPV